MSQGTMEKFPYRPIEPPDAIRMLELLPSTINDNIAAFGYETA
jgi:hypothetical protein